MRKVVLLCAFLLLSASSVRWLASPATGAESASSILSDEIVLTGPDLVQGERDGVLADAGRLALAPEASSGSLTAEVLAAPLPFNALVPQWWGDFPEGSSVSVEVRTGKGDAWTEWVTLHASGDMTLPDDPMVTGDMLVVPAADKTHEALQFRLRLARSPEGEAPAVEQLRFTVIDSTAGPTVEEMIAAEQARPQPEAPPGQYPKPFVISRAVWCTAPECNYSNGLEYVPVTHLILHHTVTTSSGDSAATVRAIWRFHTFTRGWGDIGYNYLVDTGGVIFEGHAGGDNVVGTHAAGANAGSMALSMIGNFTDVQPPAAMREAAINLFAWKADQRDIDVYDSSYMQNVDWGLPHFMGHRDVYGTTACPGDSAHPLLPQIRNEVARRIGLTPDEIYYDELDPAANFTKSWSSWLEGPRGCGFNTHSFYTWSTTDPNQSTYWGEWRPNVAVTGRYDLEVYAPYCYTRAPDTGGATYQVTDADGTSQVTVDHGAHLGIWTSLGRYNFTAGNGGKIRLTELSTDNDEGVWFDAIRLRYRAPSVSAGTPNDIWATLRSVNFEWSISNRASIASQRVQVATDPDFQDGIVGKTVDNTTTSTTITFAEDYPDLYWRVRVTSTRGEEVYSEVRNFGIDSQPPTSRVRGVFRLQNRQLVVMWGGEDAGSGVVGYNIDYRAEGSATWVQWKRNTSATSAFFVPPNPGTVYWFRSQAIDGIGHQESPHGGNGDTSTAQTRSLSETTLMPLSAKSR
jgi:hypothetical protein